MTTDHELDAPLSTEVFAEKVFDAIRAAAVVQSLHLGDRLGRYGTLADEGPLTAAELAHRTGNLERYAASGSSRSRWPAWCWPTSTGKRSGSRCPLVRRRTAAGNANR